MKNYDFEALTSNRWNLEWAYKNYNDFEVMESLSFSTNGDYTFIDANVYQFRRIFVPTISIGPRGVTGRCQCSYNSNDDHCAHVLAAILLYESLSQKGEVLEYTEKEFKEYVKVEQVRIHEEERIEQEQKIEQHKIASGIVISELIQNIELSQIDEVVHHELYHLEFDIDISVEEEYEYTDPLGTYESYVDELNISLSAKIGADKMYILKGFNHFNDLMSDEVTHRYGKYLEFRHRPEAFEQEVQKLLPHLQPLLDSQRYYSSNNRYLHMDSKHLKTLYDMFKEYPREYLNMDMLESDFEVVLNVEKQDRYYSVTVDIPDSVFVSDQELFYVDYKTIEHLKIDNEKLRYLVVEIYKSKEVLFTYDDLRNILYYLRDEDFIVKGFNEADTQQLDVSLYIDLEGDEIVVKGHYFEQELPVNILNTKRLDANLVKVLFILNSYVSTQTEDHMSMPLGEDKTYRFLESGLLLLDGLCTIYADESLKNIERPTSLNLSVAVTVDNGLIELNVESLQMSKDDIFNVLQAYRRKKKYYKLQSGEIVNLDSKDMRELDEFTQSMFIGAHELKEDRIRVPLYRAMQMENKENEYETITFKVHEQLEQFNMNFKKYNLETITISNHSEILKDYQKHGVKWLMLMKKYGFNGILADDMGLGKTLQVIAMLENVKEHKPSIVVCPASLLFNWEDELIKFESNLSYVCIHGTKDQRQKLIEEHSDVDLIITTYDYLRSDFESYDHIEFSNIIIDEAQYIKNQKTITAKAVKKLNGESRIALTGTPIENNLSELWSIFDFLMPGYLYSYAYFRRYFELPIVKENSLVKQEALRAMVEPFILRRIKKDVLLDLPEKIEKTLKVEFSEEEEKLYTAKLVSGNKEVKALLKEDRIDNIQILRLLSELRQICCDPRMIYPEFSSVSSKIKACIELVEPLKRSSQKVLIFSSFTKTLDLIEIELRKKNIKYHMLTGSNTKEERKHLVNTFQSDDSTVFLISLKAAGVGLNLTAAEYVIHFDPWWNVAAENQASDRAHRIGQKNTVQVFKLIMKNSIEEKILKMQERKQDMADIFVEGATGSFASLSKEEIMDLFNQ